MRRLPLLAPLLLAAAVPSQTAPRPAGQYALAPDAEARWVPFELTPANQIRFDAAVDGRPASAILDTGVSSSVLSRSFAGLDPKRVRADGKATAIGGAVAVGWTPTARVEIGPLTRTGGGLTVATLPAIATGSERRVDLLVGADMLRAHALEIDGERRRFRLLPSGRLPFTGPTAPLTVSPSRGVYESEIRLNGRRVRPMIVDTGDGSAMTVTRPEWQAARTGALPMTSAVSYGLAGPAVSGLAVMPRLELGELAARDVEMRIEEPGGFSQRVGAAGRIGAGFLGRYRVLLDPGAGRMVLVPGPNSGAPPVRSTSGLLLGVLPDRLRVLHVMRGGPAAASGWKDGETICSVDGVRVAPGYAALPLARWTAGEPGRVVRLVTCGGAERTLTLRRFY
ncbi:aspartyl protease family protein [Sphingomonas lenta]|uniref:PDZ domain-containing protein n=1 Tax=Sphingomonas lenta TaxID=1141887 RepID=A0A2A2SHV8_9SPHN|nr:aspartyl protease family protein [Sphingomonas lenta]PAX08805.1 hypothetical protein CKY28_05455 [Sphingomonas lenta]